MKWLREATAATITMGPFVDDTDGKTLETALGLGATDVLVSKNGGALTAKSSATAPTADGTTGYYTVALNDTDTGTLGRLRVSVCFVGALPVWDDYLVVPANVYDAIVGGSGAMDVNAKTLDTAYDKAKTAASPTDVRKYAGRVPGNLMGFHSVDETAYGGDGLDVSYTGTVTGEAYIRVSLLNPTTDEQHLLGELKADGWTKDGDGDGGAWTGSHGPVIVCAQPGSGSITAGVLTIKWQSNGEEFTITMPISHPDAGCCQMVDVNGAVLWYGSPDVALVRAPVPAVAGDAMAMTSSERTTLITTVLATLITGGTIQEALEASLGPSSSISVADILDHLLTGHTTDGTVGAALANIQGIVTASLARASASGSRGFFLQQGEARAISFHIEDANGAAVHPSAATFTLLDRRYMRTRCRLTADIGAGDTTIHVDSTIGFPNEFHGTKYIQVGAEKMAITEDGIGSGQFIVTRGALSSTPAAHYENDVVTMYAVAASITGASATVGATSPYTVSYSLGSADIAALETDKGHEEYMGRFTCTLPSGEVQTFDHLIVVADHLYATEQDWAAFEQDFERLKPASIPDFRDIHWMTRQVIDTMLQQAGFKVPVFDRLQLKNAAIYHDLYLVMMRNSRQQDDVYSKKSAAYKEQFTVEMQAAIERLSRDPSRRSTAFAENETNVTRRNRYMGIK